MTKELRPNHRLDVLTDALLFCARKRAACLGIKLKLRFESVCCYSSRFNSREEFLNLFSGIVILIFLLTDVWTETFSLHQ